MALTNNFWETITPARNIRKKTGYIILPALGFFSGYTSYGVPLIAASFTYQCPNNITLPNIPNPNNLGANYNLAIRYNSPITGTPVRYKFWDFDTNPAQDIPNAPVYAGQPIQGSNFVIEVWSQGGNPGITMPNAILLDTSVKCDKCSLEDPDWFELGTVLQCQSLTSTNGLNLPLQFLNCACAIPSGNQQGTNYRFNVVNGMLEMLNTTTGLYNPIFAAGGAGHEYLVIYPQDSANAEYTYCIPNQGANYRINAATGAFELLNITTGLHNPINTLGAAGHESILIQAQD